MNRQRFLYSVVLLVALTMFVLPVGQGFAQKKIKVDFWHHEAPAHRVAAFEKVITLFEKENPNIDVTQHVVTWGDAWPKTLAAIGAGNPPDFQFSIPELTITAYKANAILPVDDLIAEINKRYKFVPSQLAPYKYQDKYWGVPIWTMPFVLIYRPSYLQKYVGTTTPPKTWDQLLEYAKKLTVDADKDGKIDIYGIGLAAAKNLLTQEQSYSFMVNVKATFFDEKGNVVFDSPATVRAIKFYKELFKYSPPGATGWAWGEMELNFAAGKIAMMPYFGGLQKRFFDMKNFDLAAAPQPFPPDGVRGSIIYPNDVHIYKKTQERGNLEAVKKFIVFMSKPEINAILTAEQEPGSFVPVTEAALKAKAYWDNPVIAKFKALNQAIVDAIPYGKLYGFEFGRWAHLAIGDISGANVLAEVVQKVIAGEMSVEDAVAWGAKTMREMAKR